MKPYPILILLTLMILSPLDVFACACCADEGYYRIGVQKPGAFELGELKKLNFHSADIYSTAGFPDDIKGLNPITEKYAVKNSIDSAGWKFAFKDANEKSGELDLKMPKKFVHYAVDTRSGEKGGAGSVVLYKEWRFKFKVRSASGIFQVGKKPKAEYFLVLQGKGNACTSAEDFTHWRLEVTGKKSNYAFYGSLERKAATEKAAVTVPVIAGKKRKPIKGAIRVSNLISSAYSGCGCSGWTARDSNAKDKSKPIFWSELKQNGEAETLFMNINGKDTELRLLKKGARPENGKVGDKFSDEYIAGDIKVLLDYTIRKLPCEECEGTDYAVTATVIGEYSGKVLDLSGSCGC